MGQETLSFIWRFLYCVLDRECPFIGGSTILCLLTPHPSSSRDYLQGILRASSAPPVSLAASKRKEGEEGEEWSREDVWGDIERVYLQSTFDLVCDTLFVLSLTTSMHLFVYTTRQQPHTHIHTHLAARIVCCPHTHIHTHLAARIVCCPHTHTHTPHTHIHTPHSHTHIHTPHSHTHTPCPSYSLLPPHTPHTHTPSPHTVCSFSFCLLPNPLATEHLLSSYNNKK